MPKVSVVIPAYNGAKFLAEAIESVLAQTYRDFEIIIVDDGSTDNTRQVVDIFKDSCIKYIYQKNQGVSAARNRGIGLAGGEYIALLDADDIRLERSLEKQVAVLDENPGVGLVYGQLSMMDEGGKVYRTKGSSFMNRSGIVDKKEQIKELLFSCNIMPSAVLMRRSCFNEAGGFHGGLSIAEDRHLFLRLAKRYQVAYIAEPIVKYRLHPDSLHRHVDPDTAEKAYSLILREVFDDPALAPEFETWKSRAYASAYRKVAGYAYGHDMTKSRRYLRKVIKAYPGIVFSGDGSAIAYRYVTSLIPGKMWPGLRDLKKHLLASKRYRE